MRGFLIPTDSSEHLLLARVVHHHVAPKLVRSRVMELKAEARQQRVFRVFLPGGKLVQVAQLHDFGEAECRDRFTPQSAQTGLDHERDVGDSLLSVHDQARPGDAHGFGELALDEFADPA